MKFVMADDSFITRRKIRQFLETGGHEVVAEADNGQRAVELCRKHRPDAIMLDINMPYMNGHDAAQRITAERSVKYIFMLTSFQQEAGLAALRALDGVTIVNKPVNRERLLQIIDRTIGA